MIKRPKNPMPTDSSASLKYNFAQHINDFLALQRQLNRSAHTIAAYRRDLQELIQLLPNPSRPNRHDFHRVLRQLSQQGRSASTLKRKVCAWRQYATFLQKSGIAPHNDTVHLKTPKLPQRLPRAIDRETINHLLNQEFNDDEFNLRDQAMWEILYGCGLRLSELAALNIGDVHWDEAWLSVWGKGRKQRHVPIPKRALCCLKKYGAQRIAAAGEHALFTNRYGTRLGTRQIAKRLEQWAQRQGSPQHISPHMLRHSYASHLLQASRDLRAVQDLLGHAQLSSTQIYTQLDFDHLAHVYDQTHPRARRQSDSSNENIE